MFENCRRKFCRLLFGNKRFKLTGEIFRSPPFETRSAISLFNGVATDKQLMKNDRMVGWSCDRTLPLLETKIIKIVSSRYLKVEVRLKRLISQSKFSVPENLLFNISSLDIRS